MKNKVGLSEEMSGSHPRLRRERLGRERAVSEKALGWDWIPLTRGRTLSRCGLYQTVQGYGRGLVQHTVGGCKGFNLYMRAFILEVTGWDMVRVTSEHTGQRV